jgi:hypothetical protein
MWEEHGVAVDFAVRKRILETMRAQFNAHVYYHMDDSDMNRHYAILAGFAFLPVDTATGGPWTLYDGEPSPR